jgi:hypothetical protein
MRSHPGSSSDFLGEILRAPVSQPQPRVLLELEKLTLELLFREAEVEKLRSSMELLRTSYTRNVENYALENEAIKTQLQLLEQQWEN